MRDVTAMVLDLDAQLRRGDLTVHHDRPQVLDPARQALADQAAAASRDAAGIAARIDADTAVEHPLSGYPMWLRLGLLDVIVRHSLGLLATCKHIAPTALAALVAAAWLPGHAACPDCAPADLVGTRDVETCSCCGRRDPGLQLGVTHEQHLMYLHATCMGCYAALLGCQGETTR